MGNFNIDAQSAGGDIFNNGIPIEKVEKVLREHQGNELNENEISLILMELTEEEDPNQLNLM